MKKNINFLMPFLAVLILSSCNKESLIEGVSNKATTIDLNKKYYIDNFANYYFTTTISNNLNVGFYVRTMATIGYPTTGEYTRNDSIKFIMFNPPSYLEFAFSNNGVHKYNLGEDVASAPYTQPTNSLYINFAKKTPPFSPPSFSTPYESINRTFYMSNFGFINTKFKIEDDGYIVFRRLLNNSPSLYEYGWIEIKLTKTHITFVRMAYRTGTPLKAGTTED